MKLPIKGLKSFYDIENETTYYYTGQMFSYGILIEEATTMLGDKVETIVTVHYMNKIADIELDAASYTMYWGDYLETIQVYRIVKDIFEIYNENTPKDFVEIICDMSGQNISSSMQSSVKNGRDIFNRIKESFELVKSNI